MKLQIICVAYERYIPLEILCKCFQVQTNPNWMLHIIYDGPVPEGIINLINPLLKDERIHFYQSAERYQNYGHPNRRMMLKTLQCDFKDFILLTNDDNMYVPRFVEFMLGEVKWNTGLVYCNTVHSHMEYNLHISQLAENFIDIGAFIVRADVAKETGFQWDHFSADGKYAEECVTTCNKKRLKIVKVDKPLFIHN